MSEQRNIVVLGASFSGLQTAHYLLKHTIPELNAKHDARYHLYLINPSSDYYFRIASPRIAASTERLGTDKALFDFTEAFKQYPSSNFTFVQATATGLNPSERTVSYKRSEYLGDEQVSYHALVVATGSRTHDSVFSLHSDTPELLNAIKSRNAQIQAAKDIIITGGGPTSVEHAGEIGELLNGKPGWFSTPERKVKITVITAGSHLLPLLRPALGKLAEEKLKNLGVDVLYNTRVADVATAKNGRATVTLGESEKLEADLYIPAHGVLPNTSFVPSFLLNDAGYLKNNPKTLRVDEAGPRVYAIGDVASYSRNIIFDVYDASPVLMVNMKRDLLFYNPQYPNEKPAGKDRIFTPNLKETQFVPIGSAGGVGAMFGWKAPNFLIWLFKARDMMVSMRPGPILVSGDQAKKEVKWTKEEAVA